MFICINELTINKTTVISCSQKSWHSFGGPGQTVLLIKHKFNWRDLSLENWNGDLRKVLITLPTHSLKGTQNLTLNQNMILFQLILTEKNLHELIFSKNTLRRVDSRSKD